MLRSFVQSDTEMPVGQTNKMRIRRALVVSVNFINGILTPIATIINIHLSFCAKSSEKYEKLLLFDLKLQCKEKIFSMEWVC